MNSTLPFLSTLVFSISSIAAAAEPPVPAKIEFNRDVRPILSDNCFYCHGNDPKHREADLRLDLRDEAVKAEAFIPGNGAKSELVSRILTDDEDDLMPPPDSHKKLTPRQKEILKKWIDQGATYQQHWAYEKPIKAAIPAGKNPIDHLVQKRLSEIGLKPSPKADDRTLLRRLYFDLHGLPPAKSQISNLESEIASLLASPHYGERMAISWLDQVRFADTIGYHSDNPHNVWPYRDYVIESFNKNKPFDRFTIEQIAGDLMPDANQETRVGSAFNRLLLTTEEGGAQAKDYEQRMLTDRVRAVGNAWMGQTTGCAQCHDHKFDPITMRDFYTLGAFFADIKEPILGRREDGMLVTTPENEKKLAELDAKLAEAKKALAKVQPDLKKAQKAWEAEVLAKTDHKDKEAKDVLAALKAKNPNAKQKKVVDDYFAKISPLHKAERDAVAKAEAARKAFYDPLPKCIVSISDTNKRTVRILPRGNWMDESGEVVKASLPSYLPKPKIEGRDLTRLDLAQWLVSKENPLTARNVMNRLWKQFFGTGLSKVLDDLGAQGEPPVNPALLDWLACEFMDSGWDLQHMIRLIVTSNTYQQVSTSTKELTAADPYNRECARQSAFRLDAELVRDNALAISGLLVPKIGGPSVKPYQPAKYWENLNFPTREWQNDSGEGLYRRGMYTWWQRSFTHPSMLAFDAPSREECTAERNRSNIPQQALVLLNDPTYVEAARAFAARILPSEGDASKRITWAFQQALQRQPTADEMKTLSSLVAKHLADYQKDPSAAEALLKTGAAPAPATLNRPELAAWAHVARVLLNLHETVTRS
ncbi:MAG: DUF1553 domain-containing protein [Prosthecobacter sp.]|jgi:hypothetical protein|uniref:DUF1553 domain-containing protein n=1 Tax=Prosthecobacter sp. TaxID=1965333 RepID=UPI0019DDF8B3|nr:DUF1553 domain-containing protein [Prosthecobacter sp.]MBE2286190.1 DUF1553 domain-containing protein [Prosthecobacter sp.]